VKKAISAQNTKMYLSNPDAASTAAGTLTNASKSNPCVAVFDNVSNLINGAPVTINGTGWSSLDGQTFIVQNVDTATKSATLAEANTSGETAAFNSATATYVVPSFIDVCAVSYQLNQNAAATIDTTTLCDSEKTSLTGFTDPGTLTFDFFIDPTDPDYLALVQAQADGDQRWFIIVYRNGAVRAVPVIVQQVNESGGVDQAVSGSCTMKVTGAPVLTMPSGQPTDNYVLVAITTPTTGTAPLDVSMILNESGGTSSAFAIDWGDGSDIDTVTTNTADHTYSDAGSYTPSVVATVNGVDEPAFKSQTTVVVDDGGTT
jgi:hypothetical protein